MISSMILLYAGATSAPLGYKGFKLAVHQLTKWFKWNQIKTSTEMGT